VPFLGESSDEVGSDVGPFSRTADRVGSDDAGEQCFEIDQNGDAEVLAPVAAEAAAVGGVEGQVSQFATTHRGW